MLYFNFTLFSNLPKVFNMTQEDFSEKVFGVRHRYKQRLLFPDRLLVMDLIKLCNTLHMSISHFFSVSSSNAYVLDISHYVIEGTPFKTICLKNHCIENIYGKGGLANRRITQLELAKLVGVSQVTLYTWLKNPATFRVSHLLTICNELDIPFGFLIEDPNLDLSFLSPKETPKMNRELFSELRKIQDVAADNQRDIKHIAQRIKAYRDVVEEEAANDLREEDLPLDIQLQNALIRVVKAEKKVEAVEKQKAASDKKITLLERRALNGEKKAAVAEKKLLKAEHKELKLLKEIERLKKQILKLESQIPSESV